MPNLPNMKMLTEKKLIGRTTYLTGMLLILFGLLLKCTYLLLPQPPDHHPPTIPYTAWEFGRGAVNEIGNFVIVTFLLAFFYERMIREEHQKQVRADLKEVLKDHFDEVRDDLKGVLKEHFEQDQRIQIRVELENSLRRSFAQAKLDYQAELRRELDRQQRTTGNASVHNIYPEGRVSTDKKMDHIRNAKTEIIEIGTALRTFAGYFERTADFGPLIENRLANKVNLTCFMLDPDYARKLDVAANRTGKESLHAKIVETQTKLLEIKAAIDAKGYAGKMEIYTYRHTPCFAAIMVDCNVMSRDPQEPAEEGRLFYSPYLYFENNAAAPTIEIYNTESRELFKKVRDSVHKVLEHSTILQVPAVSRSMQQPGPSQPGP